ncbi:MAG TPA: protein kinase [Thermoanaerobaculia bacterium]
MSWRDVQIDERTPFPAEPEQGDPAGPHDLPERLGAYRVLGRLGRGGMGEVFLAWDDRLRRKVAIKRIRRDADLSAALRRRFLREARAAAGLSHPAIVQVHDLLEDPSGDCIVLEYVEGRTLAAHLAKGPLKLDLAVRLAREIAEALTAAHEAGIVHRDLKAENVLVTPAGHAKVLDFGLARRLAGTDDILLTQHGIVVGTFHAMSPEQACGVEVDARSDLFSLGSLLYHMLTGRSPFLGATPQETIHRVLEHHPPPVAALRPDAPPQLGDLMERLLAKAPEDRPQGAAEVAGALEDLPQSGAAAAGPPPGESVSDLPTVFREEPAALALPRITGAPASTAGMSVLRRRYGMGLTAVAVLLVVLLSAVVFLRERHPTKPLRVAVLRPEVDAKRADERLDLAASGVLMALLGGLTSLEDLAPLDPSQISAGSASSVTLARSLAADEVLISAVEPEGAMARISLRRMQASDGRVLWSTSFKIPTDPAGLRLLPDVAGMHLRRAYPDHALRPGTLRVEVREQDYTSYLAAWHRIDAGKTSLENELPSIERIVRFSPRFLEAIILAAQCHLALFTSTRDPHHLERARALVRQARELAPEDPRPLKEEFKAALVAGRQNEAEEVLGRLERFLPGDPDLLVLRADLAESRGQREEALAARRAASELAPSWQNLYDLATLTAQSGQVSEARESFQRILRISPQNAWALAELGRMELLYGDPASAEKIFTGLARANPQRYYFTNLGIARLLLGRYESAVAAYREALKIDPDHLIVLMNLADAEQALGREGEALAIYQRVLQRLAEHEAEAASPLQPAESLFKAECLAHLGRAREAAEITQKTLRQSPNDTEILYTASRVYALIGDQASALVNAKAALDKGMKPRWFSLPAFRPLQGNPEFRALLNRPEAGGKAGADRE